MIRGEKLNLSTQPKINVRILLQTSRRHVRGLKVSFQLSQLLAKLNLAYHCKPHHSKSRNMTRKTEIIQIKI